MSSCIVDISNKLPRRLEPLASGGGAFFSGTLGGESSRLSLPAVLKSGDSSHSSNRYPLSLLTMLKPRGSML